MDTDPIKCSRKVFAQEFNSAERPQEAQAVLEEAIAEDPKNPEFYKQLAMTYVEENNLSKASDTYEGFIDRKSVV